jgi:hypothetical protein
LCFLDLRERAKSFFEGAPFGSVPRTSCQKISADEYGSFGNLDELE